MSRIIVAIAANLFGIYLATRLISGFEINGTFIEFLVAALVLTLINWFVRPVVKFLSGPLIFITFGLFVIVINAAMLYLLDLILTPLIILDLTALLFATLILSIINLVLSPLKK